MTHPKTAKNHVDTPTQNKAKTKKCVHGQKPHKQAKLEATTRQSVHGMSTCGHTFSATWTQPPKTARNRCKHTWTHYFGHVDIHGRRASKTATHPTPPKGGGLTEPQPQPLQSHPTTQPRPTKGKTQCANQNTQC